MYSETLEIMLKEKKGYRTESFSGSGVRNLEDVVRFEIMELCNDDIIDYMQESYGILKSYQLEKDGRALDSEEFYFKCQENIDDVIDEIASYVKENLKIDDVRDIYVVWLTTKENVIDMYEAESEWYIDEYIIPEERIILSDLGRDGALFAFKEKFCQIPNSHLDVMDAMFA